MLQQINPELGSQGRSPGQPLLSTFLSTGVFFLFSLQFHTEYYCCFEKYLSILPYMILFHMNYNCNIHYNSDCLITLYLLSHLSFAIFHSFVTFRIFSDFFLSHISVATFHNILNFIFCLIS